MKICPNCQTKYSDSLEYCMQDGTVLSILPDPNATLRLESRPTHATAGTSNRKVIFVVLAIAGVIVVLILVAVVGMFAYMASPRREDGASNRSANTSAPAANSRQPTNVEPVWEDTPGTIQRINDEIGVALVKADFAALDRLIADDYLYENDRGLKLTKQQILIFMRSGNLRYDYVNSTDASVDLNPALTTSTLTARAQSRGQFMQQPFNDNYRYRNTYEKRSNGWQLVAGYAWYR